MTEESDLRKLRDVLASLDPPKVMVGRCLDCRYLGVLPATNMLGMRCDRLAVRFDPNIVTNAASFGCTLWERKP